MKAKARVGMIGLRGFGNIVRAGLKECKRLELAAVWSHLPEEVAFSQSELPSKGCATYEELLAEPIDAVLIILPNHLHLQYAVAAAKAGVPVLIEKPMTNTVAEGREMLAAFREHKVQLGVKHMARFAPAFRVMKKMVEDGALGRILSAEMYCSHSSSKKLAPDRWRRDPAKCPAAPLTQLGVHSLDSVMSFLGCPEWVQSEHRNILGLSDNVDCTVTTLGYKGGAIGTLHAHYVVPGYNRVAVYGTEGILINDEAGLRFKKEGSDGFEPIKLPDGNGLVEILDAFGESLLSGAPFETDGEAGLLVVATAEAAILSAGQGGRKVELAEVLG